MDVHKSHPDVIKRLKRAHGHLGKVIDMVEHEAECLMVAQQLQAVVSALSKAKTIHVQDHIEHCLAALLEKRGERHRDVADFLEIAKYL